MKRLLDRVEVVETRGGLPAHIEALAYDSRKVLPGTCFVALRGTKTDGHRFLQAAESAGAAAAVVEEFPNEGSLPCVRVRDTLATMPLLAAEFFEHPARDMTLAGFTGTNGKTSSTYLLEAIWAAAGIPSAVIGTIQYRWKDRVQKAPNTTPLALDLHTLLHEIRKDGVRHVAMEVSSHALSQERVAGLEFDVAVWTNLTRDHLDYHGDMESYFEAKRRLFTEHLAAGGRRVLPVDDPWGARLLDEQCAGDISWGLDRGAVCARMVISDLDGSRFDLRLPETELEVRLPLVGVHNLRNGLAAAAAASAAGLGPKAIRRGLKRARPLSGRLERVKTKLPFPVFVDFAHTPEGLRSVLQALDRITDRRLIVVFGAGGERDQGKRGPMGYAVGELADVQIVTSDNPRSEDPVVIAEAVADGVRAAGAEPMVVLDRKQAIRTALELADERSLVLVAGKGHEAFQTIGDEQVPFSDQNVLRSLSRRLR